LIQKLRAGKQIKGITTWHNTSSSQRIENL